VKTDVTEVMAVVSSRGYVTWMSPVNYLVRCRHEDDAVTNCTMKSVYATVFDNSDVQW